MKRNDKLTTIIRDDTLIKESSHTMEWKKTAQPLW